MHYLDYLFWILKRCPLSFLTFWLCSSILVSIFFLPDTYVSRSWEQLFKKSEEKIIGVSGLPLDKQKLTEQLDPLAIIEKIEFLNPRQMDKSIQDSKVVEFKRLEYWGILIYLKSNTSDRAKSLLLEYLSNIVGKKDITLRISKTKGLNNRELYIKIALILITLLDFFALFNLLKRTREVAYYLNSFQRKSNLMVKLSTLSFATVLLLFAISLHLTLKFTVIIVLGIIAFLYIRDHNQKKCLNL